MTQAQSSQRIQLPEVLDVTASGPLAENLLSVRGSKLTLDAGNVQRVGAQCVQVLMSAVSTWKADKADFCIVNPSPEFRDALTLLGVGLSEILIEEGQS